MDSLKNIPPHLRYLKARLKPLGNPVFWGSTAILTVLGIAAFQYWHNPHLLIPTLQESEVPSTNTTQDPDNPVAKSQLSWEELAAGADIDNLDLLLSEFEKTANITSTLNSTAINQKTQPKTLLEEIDKKQKEKKSSALNTINNNSSSTSSNSLSLESLFINPLVQLNPNPSSQGQNNTSNKSNSLIIGNTTPANSPSKTTLEEPLQQAVNRFYKPYSESTNNTTTNTSNYSETVSQTTLNKLSNANPNQQNTNLLNANPLNNTNLNNANRLTTNANSLPTTNQINPFIYNYNNSSPTSNIQFNQPANFYNQLPQNSSANSSPFNQLGVNPNSSFTSSLRNPGMQTNQMPNNRRNRPNYNNTSLQPLQIQAIPANPYSNNYPNQANFPSNNIQTTPLPQNQFNPYSINNYNNFPSGQPAINQFNRSNP